MMSTTLWLSLMIPLGAVIATAQQPGCSVKLDQVSEAPELRGFRLGMTYEQVKARVPQVRFPPPDQFGVAKTTINPAFDPSFDKPSFAGVRTISMDFLDGKLVTLWIGYDESFKWQKFDEFVAGMSKALNLPTTWSANGLGRQLTCADFSAFASMIAGSPALRITNEAAQETIGTRRAEAQAAAEAAKATAEAVVIGDPRTKLYYPNDCDAVERLPEANRVSFKDKDEAERAGYQRAKVCL
jgi:hypothetical protein